MKNTLKKILGLLFFVLLFVQTIGVFADDISDDENVLITDLQDPEYYKNNEVSSYSLEEESSFEVSDCRTKDAILGCDVSKWQGTIDWNKAKRAGINFAIIRIGYRGRTDGRLYEDNMYKKNIQGAIEAGIKVGVYFYSEAITEAEAIEEADFLINRVNGYQISLPLVIDYEGFNINERLGQANLSKDQHTKIVSAFCEKVKKSGYVPMIYGSATYFVDYMDGENLCKKYLIWSAAYSHEPSYYNSVTYDFWQYTDKGDGFKYGMSSEYLDMDYWYCDDSMGVATNPSEKIIYRLYYPATGEHLYTPDANEAMVLSTNYGWKHEGVAWIAPTKGTAVYRLYNPILGNHLYTSDMNEVNVLTSKHGWLKDNNGNPIFYSGGNVSIYRVYNAGLKGMHHYTIDKNEYNVLTKYGWVQENIAFKALR